MASVHFGRVIRTRPSAAMKVMAAATKSSWPISTPTLKRSSASGTEFCGKPTSLKAPAKPNPCSSPKVNATTHGARAVRDGARTSYVFDGARPSPGAASSDSSNALDFSDSPLQLTTWSGARTCLNAAASQTLKRAEARAPHPQNLRRHKHNAEGDDSFDRRLRDMDEAERRQRERDTVGQGERGDRFEQQSPALAHDEEQPKHKQEVVNAQQDVLDAEHEVSAGDRQCARGGFHHERRSGRREPRDLRGAVEAFHTHEHVGRRRVETGDVNRAPGQSARPLHGPAFGEGVVGHRSSWRGDVRGTRRKFHVKSEAQILSLTWHLPKRGVSLRPGLAQFEISGTHLVGEGRRGKQKEE